MWKAIPKSDSFLSFSRVKMKAYETPPVDYLVETPINLDA